MEIGIVRYSNERESDIFYEDGVFYRRGGGKISFEEVLLELGDIIEFADTENVFVNSSDIVTAFKHYITTIQK